jgi:hypothetical protein
VYSINRSWKRKIWPCVQLGAGTKNDCAGEGYQQTYEQFGRYCWNSIRHT